MAFLPLSFSRLMNVWHADMSVCVRSLYNLFIRFVCLFFVHSLDSCFVRISRLWFFHLFLINFVSTFICVFVDLLVVRAMIRSFMFAISIRMNSFMMKTKRRVPINSRTIIMGNWTLSLSIFFASKCEIFQYFCKWIRILEWMGNARYSQLDFSNLGNSYHARRLPTHTRPRPRVPVFMPI